MLNSSLNENTDYLSSAIMKPEMSDESSPASSSDSIPSSVPSPILPPISASEGKSFYIYSIGMFFVDLIKKKNYRPNKTITGKT